MAINYGAKEAVYISNFMIELSLTTLDSLPSNCDSTGALHIAGNSTYSSRTTLTTLLFLARAGQEWEDHHSSRSYPGDAC